MEILKRPPKILYWDIETSLMKVYTFGIWNVNIPIDDIIEDWRILCICYAWNDEPPQRLVGTEKSILKKFSKVLNQADIQVYHNGDKFDMKRLRARLVEHGLPPVKPFSSGDTVDTLKVAKKEFGFTSNKLEHIIHNVLQIGGKLKTDKQLWRDATEGCKEALNYMAEYCEVDVTELRKCYKALLPYITNHPNMNHYSDIPVCPNCGSTHIQKRGFLTTRATKKQRVQCMDCGAWGTEKYSIDKPTEIR